MTLEIFPHKTKEAANNPGLIHRSYRDWGLIHPQKVSFLSKEQDEELYGVALALNLAFYNLVTQYPDHNTLPEGTIKTILEKYAYYGAADGEGNDCAIYLLCEYYGVFQNYKTWRYAE